MALRVEIPGIGILSLNHLVLDLNGTLTRRGAVIDGVSPRLARLSEHMEPHLLSADTFGRLEQVAEDLGYHAVTVKSGQDKRRYVGDLGPSRCVAIGNGANDAPMLRVVALGIAVVGPEGASTSAMNAADIVCRSIQEALDLVADPLAVVATLRP